MTRWACTLAVGLVVLALLPSEALACPVCFDANDESRIAFLQTAIVLTALPLGIVGATGLWFRRRIRKLRGLDDQSGASDR
jgi:hypothetical protein